MVMVLKLPAIDSIKISSVFRKRRKDGIGLAILASQLGSVFKVGREFSETWSKEALKNIPNFILGL